MSGRWGEIPFVALTGALTLGICASVWLRQYFFGLMVLGTAALITASGLALVRRRNRIAFSLALTCLALDGTLLGVAQRDAYAATDLRYWLAAGHIPPGETLQFDGCISDEGDRRDGELSQTIDLRAIQRKGQWYRCTGRAVLRVPDPGDDAPEAGTVPLEGDRMRSWAAWTAPRNFQNPGSSDYAGFLARQRIFLLGRVKSARLLEVIPGDCQGLWSALVSSARRRIRESFARMEGENREIQSAILTALVAGDYSALGVPVREAFQNSGTYHVLVVSGMHVAWIAWVLAAGLKFLRVPPSAANLAAAAGIFFYTEIVGFQASVSRALWMFLLYLAGRALYRSSAAANVALASAFLLLAAQPDWIFDAGFQLSFISVLAICMTGAPAIERWLMPVFHPSQHMGDEQRLFLETGRFHRIGRRLRIHGELLAESASDRLHPWCGRVMLRAGRILAGVLMAGAAMTVISLSIQLWLEPLLAYHFNRLSWVAPLANLAIVPLSSLTLAAGLISSFLSGAGWLGSMVLGIAGYLASWLLTTAQFISGIPGAWQRCPTPSAGWIIAGILIVFAWSFRGWSRAYIPILYTGSVLTVLAFGYSPMNLAKSAKQYLSPLCTGQAQQEPAKLSLTILDVGEGDSLVVRFPDSRTWLIDAGGLRQKPSRVRSERAFDVGEAVVSRFLWHEWIRSLDGVVVSHADIDHAGGIPAVLRNFRARTLMTGQSPEDPLEARIRELALSRGAAQIRLTAGSRFSISGVQVDVLNPAADAREASTNEGSIVLRIEYGNFSALLTGDLEKSAERQLAGSPASLKSQLLKVAHHGSRWATSELLLSRVRPRWAAISVGQGNPFGHPAPEVVNRILKSGSLPILTLDHGAITLETDGSHYRLESHMAGLIEMGQFR